MGDPFGDSGEGFLKLKSFEFDGKKFTFDTLVLKKCRHVRLKCELVDIYS